MQFWTGLRSRRRPWVARARQEDFTTNTMAELKRYINDVNDSQTRHFSPEMIPVVSADHLMAPSSSLSQLATLHSVQFSFSFFILAPQQGKCKMHYWFTFPLKKKKTWGLSLFHFYLSIDLPSLTLLLSPWSWAGARSLISTTMRCISLLFYYISSRLYTPNSKLNYRGKTHHQERENTSLFIPPSSLSGEDCGTVAIVFLQGTTEARTLAVYCFRGPLRQELLLYIASGNHWGMNCGCIIL